MSTLAAVLFGLAMFVAGGAIGYYLGRLDHSARAARQDEVQEEFDAYRADVAEHFGKTADQFHAIGIQYRELYEHLAEGSAALCKLDATAGGAPFPPAIESRDTVAAVAADTTEESVDVEEVAHAVESDESDAADDDASPATALTPDEPGVAADDSEDKARDTAAATAAELTAEASAADEADDDVAEADAPEEVAEVAGEDDADDQRTVAEAVDIASAETAEQAPDNVVELVPRAETDVTEDKKTYS
jgi:uncharacterized membrane-anchored protein YhcB (DUF1043 family)